MRRFKKRPTNNDWAGQGCARVAETEEVTYVFVSKSTCSCCEGVVHAACVVAGDDRLAKMFVGSLSPNKAEK